MSSVCDGHTGALAEYYGQLLRDCDRRTADLDKKKEQLEQREKAVINAENNWTKVQRSETSETSRLRKEIGSLQSENIRLQNVQNQEKGLQAQAKKLNLVIQEKTEELGVVAAKLEIIPREERSNQQLQHLTSRNSQLCDEKAQMARELGDLQLKLGRLKMAQTKETTELQRELKAEKAENTQKLVEAQQMSEAALEKQKGDYELQIGALVAEGEKQTKLEVQKAELAWHKHKAELQQELKAEKAENTQKLVEAQQISKAALEKQKGEYITLSQKYEAIVTQAAAAVEITKRLEKRNKELEQEIAKLQEELRHAPAELRWYENQTNQLRQELEKANLTAVKNAAKNGAHQIEIEECDAKIELQREEVKVWTKAAQHNPSSPRFDVGKNHYYQSIKDAILLLLTKTVPLKNFPSQSNLPKLIAQVILQRINLENELKIATIDTLPPDRVKILLNKIKAQVLKEGGLGAWFRMVPEMYIDQAFRVSWPARVAMI